MIQRRKRKKKTSPKNSNKTACRKFNLKLLMMVMNSQVVKKTSNLNSKNQKNTWIDVGFTYQSLQPCYLGKT